jgi:hypothetical protein
VHDVCAVLKQRKASRPKLILEENAHRDFNCSFSVESQTAVALSYQPVLPASAGEVGGGGGAAQDKLRMRQGEHVSIMADSR